MKLLLGNRGATLTAAAAAWLFCGSVFGAESVADVIDAVQPRMVKIYGAGGFRGLEAYQSGFLVSAEGHILTVWSYVLDTEFITVHLDDGRKFDAKTLGYDPRLELAVLKIEGAELPHFDLAQAKEAEAGTRILAFSNLFGVATRGEPVSVQHGVISATTRLEARRGAYETPYNGPVYVLDAITNNPGAAGGALVNRNGELLGMLGKELRNSLNNTWLDYAIPIGQIHPTVTEIMEGKFISRPDEGADSRPKAENPLSVKLLGIVLVPDVLERTPPFVDDVRPGSPAAAAGLRPDDLILFINDDRLIQSCKALREELGYIEREEQVKLTVIRGQELMEFVLKVN